jgi:hypothetical protein
VSDFIPGIIGFEIRQIFPVRNAPEGDVFPNLFFRDGQEWSDDPALHDRNSSGSAETGSPDQIEDQGFGLVIQVMGGGNLMIPVLVGDFAQPVIPEIPGRFLDPFPRFLRLSPGVKRNTVYWKAESGTVGTDQGFIQIGFFAPEFKIHVAGGKVQIERLEQGYQAHGIHPATDRYENTVTPLNQWVGLQEGFYFSLDREWHIFAASITDYVV